MERGTIVLTAFPFTDLSTSKRRPALIISQVKSSEPDVIVAFISSVVPDQAADTEYIIDKNHPAFVDSGLIKTSIFKMHKVATLNKAIFSGEMGKISDGLMRELEVKLKIALNLL